MQEYNSRDLPLYFFQTHWDATKKCTWMMWMFIGNPERVESTNVQRIIVQVGQPSVPAPGERVAYNVEWRTPEALSMPCFGAVDAR